MSLTIYFWLIAEFTTVTDPYIQLLINVDHLYRKYDLLDETTLYTSKVSVLKHVTYLSFWEAQPPTL